MVFFSFSCTPFPMCTIINLVIKKLGKFKHFSKKIIYIINNTSGHTDLAPTRRFCYSAMCQCVGVQNLSPPMPFLLVAWESNVVDFPPSGLRRGTPQDPSSMPPVSKLFHGIYDLNFYVSRQCHMPASSRLGSLVACPFHFFKYEFDLFLV